MKLGTWTHLKKPLGNPHYSFLKCTLYVKYDDLAHLSVVDGTKKALQMHIPNLSAHEKIGKTIVSFRWSTRKH